MKHSLRSLGILVLLAWLGGCSRAPKENAAAPIVNGPSQPAAVQATGDPAKPADAQLTTRSGIFINRRELGGEQISALAAAYHYAPIPGHYWYDSASGAWGIEGHETIGFLLPGHDFGPLAADVSAGNTGVFINGREINMVEATRVQQTFGAVYQGHWWLDGRTGNYGVEGNPMPVGNIMAALRAQNSGRNGDNFWSSATARGNSSGGCSYVSVGGSTATSGCD